MISFWLQLATDDNENKFAVKMFYYLKNLHDDGIVYFKWYAFVKKILMVEDFLIFGRVLLM